MIKKLLFAATAATALAATPSAFADISTIPAVPPAKPGAKAPAAVEPAADAAFADTEAAVPAAVDPAVVDPAFVDPAVVGPAVVDPAGQAAVQTGVQTAQTGAQAVPRKGAQSTGQTAAGPVVRAAVPTAENRARARRYRVDIQLDLRSYRTNRSLLEVRLRRTDTNRVLRDVRVCLQRRETRGWERRFVNVSCRRTDSYGANGWVLRNNRTYRVHVPGTASHHAKYSYSFNADL